MMPEVKISRPVARDFDSIVNELHPTIIMRCVDCQVFLLPDEVSIVKGTWREAGEARVFPYLVCPVCHPHLEFNKDMVPLSTFVYLTREDYEHTRSAERWNMVFNLETKQFESPEKLIVAPN